MTPVIIGNAELYCADCMDILPTLPKVDVVITDPPYSENTHSNAKSNRTKGHGIKAIDFASITSESLSKILFQCSLICDRWIIATMEWRYIAEFEKNPPSGIELIRFGVWVKSNPMPQISADRPSQGWEGIAYFHSKRGAKKSWNGGGKHGNYFGPVITDGNHPTGKPLPLFGMFIENFSDFGNTVLDPFMGSGTTGVASIQMGRKFIGIEKEPKYFDIACKRIEEAHKQTDLFVEQPKPEQESLL